MASSARFDLPSGVSEGATLTTIYSNVQRAPFGSATLDRSSSFREGSENRTIGSGSTISRGDPSPHADMLPISQYLNLDSISTGEQKHARCVELKKALGILSTMTTEDFSFGAVLQTKPLPPLMLEDLKRLKSSIIESSARARNRAKLFSESLEKLDKHRHALFSRKRPRNEVFSNERSGLLSGDRATSGTNSVKMALQGHQLSGSMDYMPPRSDDKAKNMITNRRIRSAPMVDVRNEGRTNTSARTSGSIEKDREASRTTTGGLVQVEEKPQGLSPSDGWEKKMKRKRSVGIVSNRTVDGDLDHIKVNSQQRLGNESRPRPVGPHGFRSVSTSTIVGINRLDGATPSGALNIRPIQKPDMDVAPDKRERIGGGGSDKEKTTMKGIIKRNVRDGHQGGGLSTTKVKASRAPRTGSGSVFNSPATFARTNGTLEGWEQPSCPSKGQGISAVNNNRKRPSAQSPSPRSSSPPVAQWVGQRPPKNSRSRRTNLVPPVANKDELQVLPDSIPNVDTRTRLTASEVNESGPLRCVTSIPHQHKLKVESVPSPGGFSESEDSGAANKSRDKGKTNSEFDDKSVGSIQKVTHFVVPAKKNKFPIKDEVGDGVRRQGRTGRGSALSRTCLPLSREKMDIPYTTKHRKSVPDKIESKSGRPPTKKSSERKAFMHPGHVNLPSDLSGEADDDHKELIAAVNSARNFRHDACSGPFWQQMEPIFAFVTPDDVACLQEQKRLAEQLENSLCIQTDVQNIKEHSVIQMSSSPEFMFEDKQTFQSNESGRAGSSVDESQDVDTGKLGSERWIEKPIPLSQRLISALIVEDEVGENICPGGFERDTYQYASDDSPCGAWSYVGDEPKDMDMYESEIESEGELKNHKCHAIDNFSRDGSTVSNGFKGPKTGNLMYREELLQEDGTMQLDAAVSSENHRTAESQPSQSCMSGVISIDSYQRMSLDDRIMLELNSIGLFPEMVPDVAPRENDEIDGEISKLKEQLLQQVKKNKSQLCKLETAVLRERELQERNLEQTAMNKLVEMAYIKNRACRGSNASHKGGNKISRKAALFARRTFARYKKYKEMGSSCFRELLLKDEHPSPSMCSGDAKCSDGVKIAQAVKPCQEAFAGLRKSEAKGLLVPDLTIDPSLKAGPHGHGLDKDSVDAYQSPDQSFVKGELCADRGKKRELSLDDVVNNVIRSASGGSLLGGTKGKRSERDRDHNREGMIRNSTPKPGRPAIGTVRGERKTKTKQKTTQLSTSVNGLVSKPIEVTDPTLNSAREPSKTSRSEKMKPMEVLPSSQDPSDTDAVFDLSHLPLPGMDDLGVADDLVDQEGQDLGNWLALPDDGMQDHDVDFDGLLIPMDDLADVIERR